MSKQIIQIEKIQEPKVYSTLTLACNDNSEFNIKDVERLKFPFEYKGYIFKKVKVKQDKHK
jgi:hypothetical protein